VRRARAILDASFKDGQGEAGSLLVAEPGTPEVTRVSQRLNVRGAQRLDEGGPPEVDCPFRRVFGHPCRYMLDGDCVPHTGHAALGKYLSKHDGSSTRPSWLERHPPAYFCLIVDTGACGASLNASALAGYFVCSLGFGGCDCIHAADPHVFIPSYVAGSLDCCIDVLLSCTTVMEARFPTHFEKNYAQGSLALWRCTLC
jgi:hypothetical protein